MSDSPGDEGTGVAQAEAASGERVVYVMPDPGHSRTAEEEISLRKLWDILWRGKWIIISVTVVFTVGSVLYAMAQAEWYRAEVLLAPAEERSAQGLGGQLGGLAALAGVSVRGGGSAEAIAVLKSREFARAFIEDLDLVQVFFHEQWDAADGAWSGEDPEAWPDVRDAVKYFSKNVLKLSEERDSGLVTLGVEWIDPELAARWATELVVRVNELLRERALREAEKNVAFLRAELAQTSLVTLQQSIGRLLESELQKLMLARGNEEFVFRVLDPATVPKGFIRPKRWLIVAVATIFGVVLGLFLVLIIVGPERDAQHPRRTITS